MLVLIFNGEEGGCLMARTLQFMKLFAILLLWAIANLYIHINIRQMNKHCLELFSFSVSSKNYKVHNDLCIHKVGDCS